MFLPTYKTNLIHSFLALAVRGVIHPRLLQVVADIALTPVLKENVVGCGGEGTPEGLFLVSIRDGFVV